MKKEYLILVALIVLLSAYLLVHKDGTEQVPLPEIAKIAVKDVTGLDIVKKDRKIQLKKTDNGWQITGLDRKADKAAVENMLDALKKLKISALVSEKSDLRRYELDPDNRIGVTVLGSGKSLLSFDMGKTAPTYNHTFVLLDKDTNIYHAAGSFRTYFDKSAQELRDKKVMEFKEKSLRSLTLKKGDTEKSFTASEEKKDDKKTELIWKTKDGKALDKQAMDDLISALAFLECETFLGDGEIQGLKKEAPLAVISAGNGEAITLTLVKKGGEDKITALSSMHQDAFVLSSFNSKDIMENMDKLLEIEKKEAPKAQ